MMNVFLLFFICTPIFGLKIEHGDIHNTQTIIRKTNDAFSILTYQKHDGGLYYIKNEDNGVQIEYFKSKIPNEKNDIVRSFLKLGNDGKSYKYRYVTSNQETREEEATYISNPSGSEDLQITGSFSYKNPDGRQYIQGYTADKNGFHTKVAFGTKTRFSAKGIKSEAAPQPKGIDSTLLCSLAGGGC